MGAILANPVSLPQSSSAELRQLFAEQMLVAGGNELQAARNAAFVHELSRASEPSNLATSDGIYSSCVTPPRPRDFADVKDDDAAKGVLGRAVAAGLDPALAAEVARLSPDEGMRVAKFLLTMQGGELK